MAKFIFTLTACDFFFFFFFLGGEDGDGCNDLIHTSIRGNKQPLLLYRSWYAVNKESLNINSMREKRSSRHEQIDAKLTRTFIGNQYSHR